MNDRRYWYQQRKEATKANSAKAAKKRGNDSTPSGFAEASGRGSKKAKANSPDAAVSHDTGGPASGSYKQDLSEMSLWDIWRLGKKAQDACEALH